MSRRLPSPRVLRRLLDYNPETGELRWKERPVWMFAKGPRGRSAIAATWNKARSGKPALASIDMRGYMAGAVLLRYCSAHRVAWAMFYGEWPAQNIDHVNGVRNDNRIENLRSVDHVTNCHNREMNSNNTSGCTGVGWSKRHQKWQAKITVKRKRMFLGRFERFEDAVAARKAAEARFGFHPNHGREKVNR